MVLYNSLTYVGEITGTCWVLVLVILIDKIRNQQQIFEWMKQIFFPSGNWSYDVMKSKKYFLYYVRPVINIWTLTFFSTSNSFIYSSFWIIYINSNKFIFDALKSIDSLQLLVLLLHLSNYRCVINALSKTRLH